mmetsp:Transcript_1420/g.3794  ORF Transcript_1420/g.3794 Transcript_1420/m.3794 type:complete len:100 (-) Transcript_1420:1663-1962(-)
MHVSASKQPDAPNVRPDNTGRHHLVRSLPSHQHTIVMLCDYPFSPTARRHTQTHGLKKAGRVAQDGHRETCLLPTAHVGPRRASTRCTAGDKAPGEAVC